MPTVLIVDDTPANIKVLAEYLASHGFAVMVAQDGEEGITRAQFGQPDLILLDVMMPGLDGFETCRRLKASEKTSGIPVIFITALFDIGDKMTGYDAGGVDYVTKPFQVEEVLARVNTHLALRAARQQLMGKNLQLQQEVAVREQAEAALQRAYEGLEERVAQRTIELARANASLKAENVERKRAEEALRKSEEQWRDVFENNPTMYFMIDVAGKVISVNPFGADQLGYTTAELIGHSVLGVFCDADKDAVRRNVELCLENMGQTMNWEIRKIRKDGTMLWVRETARAVPRENSAVVLIACEDITARKQAEEDLRKAHDELERRVQERTRELEKSNQRLEIEVTERKQAEAILAQRSTELARSNAELEQLAYVASHDLQEPLRMVASYLQLLAQRYKNRLDADADEFIGFAVDGARRMQALIEDLLAFSRVGTKAKPLQPTASAAVVETAVSSLRVAIDESGARIQCDALPVVLGDAVQLTQLFQNLIGNAIKFRRENAPEIHIGAEREDGFWRFSLRDNGIGISPEYFERIFVMFQRLHGRREYSGTGIGLAICKKIVERHGGQIWVESSPGAGSTFKFTLPVERRERRGAGALESDSGVVMVQRQ
jgi:PAS domain S-box-containing protein